MNWQRSRLVSAVRRNWNDRRGSMTLFVAFSAVGMFAMAGLVIDYGMARAARVALQANTNAAALAAAYTLSQAGGTATAAATAAQNWHSNNPVPNVTVTASTATSSCVTSVSGLPNCSSTAPNVVQVTQTGTVSTTFGRVLGVSSITISTTAAAAKAGGSGRPLNVMFVLDGTGSMSSADGTGCTIPNISNPSKFQCAMYGVQLIAKQMLPSQDRLGLMIFPGSSSTWVPTTSGSCNSMPSSVNYRSSPIYYQVSSSTSLDTNYNNGSGVLTDTDYLIRAVGDYAKSPKMSNCAQNPGGQSTYYAEALTKAQAALVAQGASGSQNVIILLSDGASNAPDASLKSNNYKGLANYATYGQKQCWQGVQAAQAATQAGTWVYAIAYDAPTTNDSSDCPTVSGVADPYNPCTAMQAIASDATKFFSTSSSCQWSSSPNNYSDVATAFQQVAATLFTPRLVQL
jgi:Flp pilus assembly protein TadG